MRHPMTWRATTTRPWLKTLTADDMARESAAISAHILQTLSVFKSEGDGPVKLGLYVHCAKLREAGPGRHSVLVHLVLPT